MPQCGITLFFWGSVLYINNNCGFDCYRSLGLSFIFLAFKNFVHRQTKQYNTLPQVSVVSLYIYYISTSWFICIFIFSYTSCWLWCEDTEKFTFVYMTVFMFFAVFFLVHTLQIFLLPFSLQFIGIICLFVL